MKGRKGNLVAIGVITLVLLILTALGVGISDAKGQGIINTKQLDGKVLAGIQSMSMAQENAQVLFETILGVDLAGYHAMSTIPQLIYELRSGRADAICCPDVTAEYLLRTQKGLKRLEAPSDTSESVEGGGRLEFAMLLPKEEEALRDEISVTISEMKRDGALKALRVAYADAGEPLDLYAGREGTGKKIYVGVTGTLAPLDRFDDAGKPCGFSVALLEELGKRTGYRFELVPVGVQEAFSALERGKVDVLFAYGTGKNTTPGEKDFLLTEGYYTMQEYAYLALE